jgi:hypothetical protein
MVGPGIALRNVDESLLTPTTWDAAAQNAFIASGTPFGATDDGWSFSYSPDYQEWEFAGVPGNVRGGRRITGVEVTLSGAIIPITESNMDAYIPGTEVTTWQTTATTPVRIGAKIQPTGLLLDADYYTNICVIAERQGQKIGGVFIIKNAINTEDFTLDFSGDEDRSTVDMTFTGTYGGADSQDATTGAWEPPCVIYLADPPATA